MGAGFNKAMKPEELALFKNLHTDPLIANIEIPERAENRTVTNRKFLIVFPVVLVILMPFLIYTLVYADIGRLFDTYDTCGNVCGQKNAKYDQWSCTGQDFTDRKYLEYNRNIHKIEDFEMLIWEDRSCVNSCKDGYTPILGRCYPVDGDTDVAFQKLFSGLGSYLNRVAWRITLACFLSLGITLLILFLFRTATAVLVWSILVAVIVFGAIVAGLCWNSYLSSSLEAQQKQLSLVLAIFFTALILVLFCIMVFMYKKIQLVITLLKEAMKAQFAMPLLIFIPILTFLAEVIIVALFLFTTIYITTSGILTQLEPDFLYYHQNVVMIFTGIFNFWMTFWATQLVIGIQYMVIAGAVSKWYFAKNKHSLGRPIATSASITFKYHLGSIIFGSMIITLIAIVRSLLSSLTKNKSLQICINYCTENIEAFLKFLSKNSYILTAMHGEPFYKSGKRAARIIFQNAVNIASINFVGDFILAMAQFMIIIFSLLLTWAVMQGASTEQAWAVYVIVFIVSTIIAATFFGVFETTIDTIFLCFCEDSLLNDGMARPYAMSRDLMEFLENSKKLYGEKKI